jgi:hypothetical protein
MFKSGGHTFYTIADIRNILIIYEGSLDELEKKLDEYRKQHPELKIWKMVDGYRFDSKDQIGEIFTKILGWGKK